MFQEGELDGVQDVAARQAFDRGDVRPLMHHRELKAGQDAPSTHQHRAGTALPLVAALLRAGQIQAVAQQVEQRDPGFHGDGVRLAVDAKRQPVGGGGVRRGIHRPPRQTVCPGPVCGGGHVACLGAARFARKGTAWTRATDSTKRPWRRPLSGR